MSKNISSKKLLTKFDENSTPSDPICIAATGRAEIANIAKNAQTAGCKGLFIYPDLSIFTDLNNTDTQYGSANFGRGDPSVISPIPAVPGNTIRRSHQELIDAGLLPRIPILSVSKYHADALLRTSAENQKISMSTGPRVSKKSPGVPHIQIIVKLGDVEIARPFIKYFSNGPR